MHNSGYLDESSLSSTPHHVSEDWRLGHNNNNNKGTTAPVHTLKAYSVIRGVAPHIVCPCHHGMARPQVADRGTASDKDGSCE